MSTANEKTRRFAASCAEYDLILIVKAGTDLDDRFDAIDEDTGDALKVNGWLWSFEAIEYTAQAARDAQASGYGGAKYCAYLEEHALELHAKGVQDALTRGLCEALAGNDGD